MRCLPILTDHYALCPVVVVSNGHHHAKRPGKFRLITARLKRGPIPKANQNFTTVSNGTPLTHDTFPLHLYIPFGGWAGKKEIRPPTPSFLRLLLAHFLSSSCLSLPTVFLCLLDFLSSASSFSVLSMRPSVSIYL